MADRQLEAGKALLNLSRTAAMVLGPAAAGVVIAVARGARPRRGRGVVLRNPVEPHAAAVLRLLTEV